MNPRTQRRNENNAGMALLTALMFISVMIIVLTFGFDINVNFFSILGIVGAWYYHKFSY